MWTTVRRFIVDSKFYRSLVWDDYRSFGGFWFLLLIAPICVGDGVGFRRVSVGLVGVGLVGVGIVGIGVVPVFNVFRILVGC